MNTERLYVCYILIILDDLFLDIKQYLIELFVLAELFYAVLN